MFGVIKYMLFNFIANEDAYDRLIRENATEQLTDEQFIEREMQARYFA